MIVIMAMPANAQENEHKRMVDPIIFGNAVAFAGIHMIEAGTILSLSGLYFDDFLLMDQNMKDQHFLRSDISFILTLSGLSSLVAGQVITYAGLFHNKPYYGQEKKNVNFVDGMNTSLLFIGIVESSLGITVAVTSHNKMNDLPENSQEFLQAKFDKKFGISLTIIGCVNMALVPFLNIEIGKAARVSPGPITTASFSF